MTPRWQSGHLYLPGDLVQPVSAPAPVNTALTNPGFESGVITGWTVTQTGGTGTASVATDKKFVGTYAGRWQGAAGTGYGSGVEAEWVNATEAAVVPGRSVSATLYIALDDTSSSQNRGEVRLYWYDASHALLSHSSGTLIHGNNSSFFASTVTATAPAGAAYVRLGAWTTANASGGVRIDAASWSIVAVTTPAGLIYKATQADPATSASTEPAWPATVGATVVDGGVTWEGVQASRVEWTASPVMVTGATEPDWPTTVGASVSDGTIEWECISRRVEDPNCPNTTARIIIASKVFATDGDIDRFCATANPLDWTTPNDAGYLPTGLQSANANDAAVLAQYRGNLISMNASSFQNWQVDPDPAAMALLDQMEGIGSTWQHAAQPVANDLFFLSKLGVRSVGISAGADNLAAGDIGMPIDVLVQAAMADAEIYGITPLATYYPSAGQYWLAFPEVPNVACAVPTTYNGGQAIPSTTLVTLGSGTGYITFRFATGGVPDKAEVYIGGTLVLDTGWWGDAGQQFALNNACTNLGLTSGTINAQPVSGESAYEQWDNGNAVVFDIHKTTSDTVATVKVYAPLDSTAWKFELGCPGAASVPTLAGDLPDGGVGDVVSYGYTANGGLRPYVSYAITAGALPDGLTLDTTTGVVSGTLAVNGTFSWTVQVTDSLGQTATCDDTAVVTILLSGLRPRVVSWWDFEDSLADQARGGNTQVGAATYEANDTATGMRLAEGTVPISTATNYGFNYYYPATSYSNFAFGARLSVSKLTDVTGLITVGADSGSAVTGVVSIGINASGKWQARIFDPSGAAQETLTSTTSAAINTETHVGLNYLHDEVTDFQTIELRINGVVEYTTAVAVSGLLQTNASYVIGTREGSGYRPRVSEMFWAHEPLNDEQWLYLHNGGNKRFYADFGNAPYGTTHDAFLASVMSAKAGAIYKLNGVLTDSATYSPVGTASLVGGATFSGAQAAPAGFGADQVLMLDGAGDALVSPNCPIGSTHSMTLSTWFYQTSAASTTNTYSSSASYLVVGGDGGEPQMQRSLAQVPTVDSLFARYQDTSHVLGNSVETPSRLNGWRMLTLGGHSTNYLAPMMNGIVMGKPYFYNAIPTSASSAVFSVGGRPDGTDCIAGYASRAFVVRNSNLSLPDLAKLYDLGMGSG